MSEAALERSQEGVCSSAIKETVEIVHQSLHSIIVIFNQNQILIYAYCISKAKQISKLPQKLLEQCDGDLSRCYVLEQCDTCTYYLSVISTLHKFQVDLSFIKINKIDNVGSVGRGRKKVVNLCLSIL